jgi:hypothetical protein
MIIANPDIEINHEKYCTPAHLYRRKTIRITNFRPGNGSPDNFLIVS